MPVLNLQVSDLAGLFLRLLLRGAVWPKSASSNLAQTVSALMPTYKRLIDRDNNLLTDAFPSTAEELLPEWEATLGLPDPCAGEDATIAQRQAHVKARLTQQNGPSIPSLTAFAAALGYAITITEYAPARVGQAVAGAPCYGPSWAFAWTVTSPSIAAFPAQAGHAVAGDPLVTYSDGVLACELTRLAPAHTLTTFDYQGSGQPAPLDGFVLDDTPLQ